MTTQIAEYSKTEAALDELRARWAEVPDAETNDGYAMIKVGLSDLCGFRTGLEKKRVELKAPILEKGRLLDAEAKRITAELTALEQPMAAAKKVVDEREAREKAERLARLRAKIEEMLIIPTQMKGKPSEDIAEAIEKVDAIDATKDYYDLTTDAIHARREVLEELRGMLMERLGFEAEQERLKAEAEKQAIERAEIDAAQAEVEAARKILADQAAAQQDETDRKAQAKRDLEAAEALQQQAENDARAVAEMAEKRAAEAVEAERARAEAERLKEEEATAKREVNKRHCTKINNSSAQAIKDVSMAFDTGENALTIGQAELIIKAIANNEIPNVSINY